MEFIGWKVKRNGDMCSGWFMQKQASQWAAAETKKAEAALEIPQASLNCSSFKKLKFKDIWCPTHDELLMAQRELEPNLLNSKNSIHRTVMKVS